MTHTPSLTVRTDVASLPAGSPTTRYLLVSVTAPEAARAKAREPINVSFVLDRSGSMGGGKIDLAREAVADALSLLRHDDRFSLVVYDDRVDVVVSTVAASAEARGNALRRLKAIDARGSTDLAGGWAAGCDQVAPHLADEPAGRCLLLTDGLANVGETDRDPLVARARALRDRHIVTSTFGVGSDFDEELLQGIAEASGGHFYFIEQARQIPDLLMSELGEALEVVAHGANLAIQLPAGATAEPLTRFEWCPTDSGLRIGLGDLVSRQELTLVIRLDLPAVSLGQSAAVKVNLSDREAVMAQVPQELSWTAQEATTRVRRDRVVDREVAGLYAARARHEALSLNRAGEFKQARELLERVAARIASYAGHDSELLQIVRRLRAEAREFGETMDAMAMKAQHFMAYSVMQSRAVDGKARRKP